MRLRIGLSLLGLALAIMPIPAVAQCGGEIIVTASRREAGAELNDIDEDDAGKVTGIDKPVACSRASLTEVLRYVPYSYRIVPVRP